MREAIEEKNQKRIKFFSGEIAEETGLKADDIIAAMTSSKQEKREFRVPKDHELRAAEWQVMTDSAVESKVSSTFKLGPHPLIRKRRSASINLSAKSYSLINLGKFAHFVVLSG
ncbi:hypothetical protein [Veronia nyctiphanis]|uniref:hypothetical protein n=1 Tax=Veronia nyctiphanis TaxID=1278244 RepID=UPI001F342693|nr:hypothetical protein [Veronia nyctiphanis]